MKDNKAYIDLSISACKKISEYLTGITETTFLEQSMVQSAVIMQLHVIGEMAKKLDEETRETIDAPWSMIIGLRNIISHEYFMLELDGIWKIATSEVPLLEQQLHEYLQTKGTSYIPPFDDASPLMEE